MMRHGHSFFTSPCKGEVARRSGAKAGGWGSCDLHKMTHSLTLPLSGGGKKKGEVDR